MQSLFLAIIKISIQSSFLIFLIFFIKKIANKYLTPNMHYYIWLILVLKLLIPFSIETQFNILNYTRFYKQIENIGEVFVLDEKNTYAYLNNTNNKTENIVFDTIPKNNKTSDFNIHNFNLTKILSYVWFLGFLIIKLVFLISNIIFSIKIKRNMFYKNENIINLFDNAKQKFNIKCNIPIIFEKNISTPTLFSFISPKLILQPDIYEKFTTNEIDYIFRHELFHFKRKDLFIFWMVSLLKSIYWFNPFIWYSFYKMECDCESSCDASVLKTISKEEYSKYGLTIVKILSDKSNNLINTTTLGTLKSYKDIKRRISMISKFQKNNYKKRFSGIFVFFILALFSVFFTKPLTKEVNAEPIKSIIESKPVQDIKNPIIFDEVKNYIVVKKTEIIKSATDIKQIDSYLDNKYEFIVNGISENTVQKLDNKLINTITKTTKDGYTTMKILSNEIIAFSITEDKDNIYFTPKKPKEVYKNIVIIDPAHGGVDFGATNLKILEKDLTLSLANKIKYISENTTNPKLKIYLTRQTDKKIKLEDATKFANDLGGVYVNLHYNASQNVDISGTQIYYFKENLEGKKLAKIIQEDLYKTVQPKNIEIKEDDFYMIKNVKIPAISLEVAFITNKNDIEKITDKSFNEKVALSVLNSLNKYSETSGL